MAETKYGKYFFSGLKSGDNVSERGVALAYLDDEIMRGCHFYRFMWHLPHPALPSTPGGHPPHIHKDAELLIHLGTNPDDPFDLGAEVEMYMGKEMEKHTFTKSTVIWIPPNFIHCPWIIKRAWRPWIFIQINQGPLHTEKFYPQILPKELRDQMHWGEDEWH